MLTALLALVLANPMAFPATIPPSPQGYDFGQNIYAAGKFAFEHGGKQWVIANQGGFDPPGGPNGDYKLHAQYSSDGVTWTEADAAGAPNIGAVSGVGLVYTVGVDGSTAVVIGLSATAHTVPPTGLNVWKLNLTGAGSWSGPTAYANGVGCPTLDWDGNDTSPLPAVSSGGFFLDLVVRAPGDYLLLYSGPREVSTGTGNLLTRIYRAPFDGTTFGSGTILPNQVGNPFWYRLASGISDSSKLTYPFGIDNDFSSADGPHLIQWLIKADNSFGTTQTVAPGLFGMYWQNLLVVCDPIIYTPTGGVETIAIASEFFNDNTYTTVNFQFFSAPTGLIPAWGAGSAVTTGTDLSTGSNPNSSPISLFPVPNGNLPATKAISLAFSNNTLALIWTTTTHDAGIFNGHFYYSTSPANVLSWTAPALLFDSLILVPGVQGGEACQVFAYPSAALGGIGVAGNTMALQGFTYQEGLQFSLIPVAAPPAPPTLTIPGPAGRKVAALTPNQFDHCLHREYRLFCNIDYNLKGCARLPACFRVDEREWGDQG